MTVGCLLSSGKYVMHIQDNFNIILRIIWKHLQVNNKQVIILVGLNRSILSRDKNPLSLNIFNFNLTENFFNQVVNQNKNYYVSRGRCGRDRMVVGYRTIYAISSYHHLSCEFEPRSWQDVLDTTLFDKVCQWLTTSRWFSPCTPDSSTNKTDRHDITEILLKVASNTINQYFVYEVVNQNKNYCVSLQVNPEAIVAVIVW